LWIASIVNPSYDFPEELKVPFAVKYIKFPQFALRNDSISKLVWFPVSSKLVVCAIGPIKYGALSPNIEKSKSLLVNIFKSETGLPESSLLTKSTANAKSGILNVVVVTILGFCIPDILPH